MKFAAVILAISMTSAMTMGQTTRPISRPDLELRAQETFTRGDYAAALPLLKKLAVDSRNDTARVASILEQIRVCERNLAAGGQAAPATQPTGPRQPHVKPGDGQVLDTTIQTLGNFEYDADKGGNIPKDVTDLSGSRLRLIGFMIPMDQTDKITKFALVPDLFACCFGQPPQLQHTVVVNCPPGKAVSYFPDEIKVEGILKVQEKKDDGFIVSVFELEAVSVKPAVK